MVVLLSLERAWNSDGVRELAVEDGIALQDQLPLVGDGELKGMPLEGGGALSWVTFVALRTIKLLVVVEIGPF